MLIVVAGLDYGELENAMILIKKQMVQQIPRTIVNNPIQVSIEEVRMEEGLYFGAGGWDGSAWR